MSFLKKSIRGFTLVELMVALFIMSVSTALLLANYPDSTVRIELLNNVHKFALLIREAQIRGSAVDSANESIGGYGVFIDSATSSQAVLFADGVGDKSLKNSSGFTIGNGIYDQNATDTLKSTLKLKEGFTFKKLCVASSTATGPVSTKGYLCREITNGDNSSKIKTLTISFIRPSQTAHIYVNGSTLEDFSEACIQIYSLKTPTAGHVRSIQVYHAGVITTTATACE